MADLSKDSLEHIELLLEIELEFGVSIPDEVAETIETVADAIRYIDTHRRAVDAGPWRVLCLLVNRL